METDKISGKELWNKVKTSFVTDQVFWKNEVRTNLFVAKIMIAMAAILLVSLGLDIIGIFTVNQSFMVPVCIYGSLELLIPASICLFFHGEKAWLKYLMLLEFVIVLARLDSLLTFNVPCLIVVATIISCCYYSQRFTIHIATVNTILFAISAYCGAYYGIGMADMNFKMTTAGNYLSQAEYSKNVMIQSFLPKWMVFALVATICSEIAKRGRNNVLAQHNISKEQARVETELGLASRIQQRALPIANNLPELEESLFDLSARMIPAKEVGGDFYDFFYLDPTHLVLMIADVSGKGVPAALFMMISKILIEHRIDENHSPAMVLAEVNHELCEKQLEDMFVTVWLGILNLENGELVSASAGHEYPILCRKGEEFQIFKDKHGLVLGAMDGMRYPEVRMKLEIGDIFFVYTDGVPEANDLENKQFGFDRTLAALNRHKEASMDELLDGLKAEIDAFAAGAPPFDDTTMLAIKLEHYMVKDGIAVVPGMDSFSEVVMYVEKIMEENEVSMKLAHKMNVAVDEIYSNIVHYSNATWAQVVCKIDENSIRVRFKDNGLPYNPLEAKEPDLTLDVDEREIGGLGIFLTRKLMSDVVYHYESGYNILEIMLMK